MSIRFRRAFSAGLMFSALAVGGLALGHATTASAEPEEAPKKCTAKKFEFKEVEEACKKNGQAGAKKLMKGLVKKAKAAGEKIKCKGCHEDMKTYKSKKNASADFKKLLEKYK